MRNLAMRPAVVVFLSLCAWAAVSLSSHGQQRAAAPGQAFPASAWRALAHGKPADAAALARARPADDPSAVAVLAHIAVQEGRYDEALAALQPAASRAPLSDAALELGLLEQRLGRAAAATTRLTALYTQPSSTAQS